ncbi:unnamed protein product [Brugia timori]|uniref:Uncharacterized protein n=1 Tax=Brugia timori TaxID=42155 RepID=A0A0R3RBN1_9BILA|nr:unnamed protein product [Brugia timori]
MAKPQRGGPALLIARPSQPGKFMSSPLLRYL